MAMRWQLLILVTFLAVLLGLGVYVQKRYLGPEYLRHKARRAVRALARQGKLREGDILFQTSRSGQSRAIQAATHSPYSHCGILYRKGRHFYVLEAVQPVRFTRLEDWVARGREGRFAIRRLKKAETLSPQALARMRRVGKSFLGRPYDLPFSWTDQQLYCSELVWKIYRRGAGVELGRLQQLRDFDLSAPAVQVKLAERYGTAIPLHEPVISPARLFESELLTTVASTY